ncbi:hypothetical protein [Methanobrevibacter olleyae]|uniref:Uncharacterized protein n=1 Tax=Methanobrevibacter olleyae TaxID=294671 RepID=A0A126R3R2_METOL|nr:hypothetical protein [Methanobrevibacter olleyae]AMK16295.1 hypothetical protein YLM1_1740 [Methanobrevibacter olleyae]
MFSNVNNFRDVAKGDEKFLFKLMDLINLFQKTENAVLCINLCNDDSIYTRSISDIELTESYLYFKENTTQVSGTLKEIIYLIKIDSIMNIEIRIRK